VHFFESRRRGYVLVELERAKMQVQMRVVSDAHDPKASIATLKTYAIESGHPGVVEAQGAARAAIRRPLFRPATP